VNSLTKRRQAATGTCTRCDVGRYQPGDRRPRTAHSRRRRSGPTTSGPGRNRNGPSFGRAPSHQNRKTRLTNRDRDRAGRNPRGEAAMMSREGVAARRGEFEICPRNRRHSRARAGSASGSGSGRSRTSMPVITDDGTNSPSDPDRASGKGDLDHPRQHHRRAGTPGNSASIDRGEHDHGQPGGGAADRQRRFRAGCRRPCPPTIPAMTPANNGAPEASATPRHSGNATSATTKEAGTS
jgi:hypothetical protein